MCSLCSLTKLSNSGQDPSCLSLALPSFKSAILGVLI